MISKQTIKKFCCEDPSLIENYDKAIADTTQMWECHHRGEVLPCGRFSRADLKKFGLYYHRPASELIFLTPSVHRQLHKKGFPRSEATKKAIGEAKKGIPLSEAHKKAISYAKKGVPIGPMCEAHKKAISDAQRGITRGPMSEAHKKALSEAHKGVNVKKVMQFTKSRELIKEWPSLREAELELGIASSNICYCCNGMRKSAGGYIWQYSTL